jgi:AbrB family looped-hinge helix DNA binding protein
LETTTVTRKGQVTIPASLRKKYGIKEGMKIEVLDAQPGLVLRPIPRMEDLAGVDAGKYTYEEMVGKLDKLRQRWR